MIKVTYVENGDDGWGPRVKPHLTPDLLKKGRGGYCYVVSEAIYHTLAQDNGYQQVGLRVHPVNVHHEGHSHWFLYFPAIETALDLTADQFKTPVPYERGVPKGFLTKQPSKRTQALMERMGEPYINNSR